MNSFEEEETKLQQRLKQHCNSDGKEMNLSQSAEILNELGLLYKSKSSDKIKLIHSIALLNAAIIRQPDNIKFQQDLHEVCKLALHCANAEQKEANLVNVSKRVSIQLKEMRENTCLQLNNIEQIPENLDAVQQNSAECKYIQKIKSLQLGLAGEYKRIMAHISRQCIKIMGSPPCAYTLLGMGSLARNEITPFSDFEHILLIENLDQQINSNESFQVKEYFRWYSVLFHIVIINLQETIIPNVSIPCLNDTLTPGGNWFWDNFTPQGISFDSLKPLASKVPLGRTQKTRKKPWTTELIQPVDEMVKYLEVEVDLKNGYKLGDILTKTCYVDGSETIYGEFCGKVKAILQQNQNNPISRSNLREQLDDDLLSFDVGDNFQRFMTVTDVNIKRTIYRSITLFMCALGRLHGVDKNSSFEIIDEFQRKQVISEVSAHRLSHAVAVVCHIRLFHYMAKKKQDDTIYRESDIIDGRAKLEELTRAVSRGCLIKCLATADSLQLVMKKDDAIGEFNGILNAFDFTAQLRFFYFLGLYKEGITVGERHLANQTVLSENDIVGYFHLSSMYVNEALHDKCIALNRQVRDQLQTESKFKDLHVAFSMNDILCWLDLGQFQQVMRETDALLKTTLNPKTLFDCLFYNGLSKMNLQKYREALSAFRDMQRLDDNSKTPDNSFTQAFIHLVSTCLIRIGRIRQGVHMAREGWNFTTANQLPEYASLFAGIIDQHAHLLC